MAELRRIVAADLDRLERINEAWSYLSDDEQEQLALKAEALAADDDDFVTEAKREEAS